MRRVQVFTIGRRIEAVMGVFVQVHTFKRPASALYGGPSRAVAPLDLGDCVHLDSLPVHEIVDPRTKQRYYIAMDVELRGILEAQFRGEIERLERRLRASIEQHAATQGQLVAERNGRRELRALPWHRRLWRAWNKDL